MANFWHAFIPLFVALDGVGLLPLYWALAHRLSPRERQRATTQAAVTALAVAVLFLMVSRVVFTLMGLEFADIMVAGGAILIVLCLRELLLPSPPPTPVHGSLGVVPLGVPLLAGPAVLTTVLLVRDQHGWQVTLAALIANMALVWIILRAAEWLMRLLGREGAEAISKIFSLVLTAFGVMLIRQGVVTFLSSAGKW